ncbi:unnamed protein product, partial [Polarella glacialis]
DSIFRRTCRCKPDFEKACFADHVGVLLKALLAKDPLARPAADRAFGACWMSLPPEVQQRASASHAAVRALPLQLRQRRDEEKLFPCWKPTSEGAKSLQCFEDGRVGRRMIPDTDADGSSTLVGPGGPLMFMFASSGAPFVAPDSPLARCNCPQTALSDSVAPIAAPESPNEPSSPLNNDGTGRALEPHPPSTTLRLFRKVLAARQRFLGFHGRSLPRDSQ